MRTAACRHMASGMHSRLGVSAGAAGLPMLWRAATPPGHGRKRMARHLPFDASHVTGGDAIRFSAWARKRV